MAAVRASVLRRLSALHSELGITPEALTGRALPAFADATRLMPVGLGTDGRDKLLIPAAASAWHRMQKAAAVDGIELQLISAFRSIDFQAALIRAKLARGQVIDDVLKVNAPPGYSEHHTGRAVDIGEAGCAALDDAFDRTAAFEWLQHSAVAFGFSMTYPQNNAQGFLYEPWHWCFNSQDRNSR